MSQVEAFSFSSRGDAVSGRLWIPASPGPHPLVLVAPGLGRSQRAPAVEALCATLAAAGLTAAVFDLPLQGARSSRKLSARLLACAGGALRSPAEVQLWEAFRQQVGADLRAALAALDARGGFSPGRLACLAFEPGAEAAAAWAASEPRLRVFHRMEADTATELAARLAATLSPAA